MSAASTELAGVPSARSRKDAGGGYEIVHLPRPLTPLVGRAEEVNAVLEALAASRLVTLTGSGGCGKTRLALAVAETAPTPADGTWFVDLAPLRDPALVTAAIAAAVGVREDALTAHLRGRSTLLLIDNCEHVIDGASAEVEVLLQKSSGLRVLATSREPLGVPGEVKWRVPSLALPEDETAIDVAGIAAADAVALFVERARRARPSFALTNANAAAVAAICRRVDGVPLALELAAARLSALSPAQIATGLADQFAILSRNARGAPGRQQTLRASIDWSYDLLTPREQEVFCRLGVFAGSFDLDAAVAITSGSVDELAQLVDKSMILAEDAGAKVRYRLLDSLQLYAVERLDAAGEEEVCRNRHRDHYVNAVRRWAAERRVVPRARDEINNLRVAFDRSLQTTEVTAALTLAAELYPLWQLDGWVEGRGWLDVALRLTGDADPYLRATALAVSAHLEGAAFAAATGHERAVEATAIARQLGDAPLLARCLTAQARSAVFVAPRLGVDAAAEAVTVTRSLDDEELHADALAWLGCLAMTLGDYPAARTALEEGATTATIGAHLCRAWLADALALFGETDDAERLAALVITEARSFQSPVTEIFGLSAEGMLAVAVGNAETAAERGLAILEIAGELHVPLLETYGYLVEGQVAMMSGQPADATSSFERAERAGLGVHSVGAYQLQPLWAEAALLAGDLETARDRARAAVDEARSMDLVAPLGWALLASATVWLATGDEVQAEDEVHEALAVSDMCGDRRHVIEELAVIAELWRRVGREDEATRLARAAESARESLGTVASPVRAHLIQHGPARAGDEPVMTLKDAVAYARRGRGTRRRAAAGWASLTPSESQVARLVAEGLPNKEIAKRLFVSPRTVQSHLTWIYAKLGTDSRVRLAAIVEQAEPDNA